MGKTLAIILNHNLPELTDKLYSSIKPYQNNEFDLFVMDNGSLPEFRSINTSIFLDQNVFWGGALNHAFDLFLDSSEYDSLLFLNNDLEVNGAIFIQSLRKELFSNDLAIVSACIAGKPHPWKQMQNWASNEIRIVKWIDNQAPLFHRKFIEKVRQFDEKLIYGWGQELVCHDICEKNNWKIGVCDNITMIHFGQQTSHRNRLFSLNTDKNHKENLTNALQYSSFEEVARTAWLDYFKNDLKKFETLTNYGLNYGVNDIVKMGDKSGNDVISNKGLRKTISKLFGKLKGIKNY